MQKEIKFKKEMASEQRLQENGRGVVPLYFMLRRIRRQMIRSRGVKCDGFESQLLT